MRALPWVRKLHRWLGAALCLLFLLWTASGVVMTFAGFPSVKESERFRRAQPLDPDRVLAPPQALVDVARDADSVDLVAIEHRPAYRIRRAGRTTTVFADTGEQLAVLDERQARAVAAGWLAGPVATSERVTAVDQWTPQADRHGQLPFLKVSGLDAAATEVYVSLVDGQVVQKTTAKTRTLAWLGAIPHWLYPIQLRRHATVWRSFVILLSGLGALASAAGLFHGVAVARRARRSARGERLSVTPFRDAALGLHHVLGLGFGVLAFTWVLSGMLSFYPLASVAEVEPRSAEVSALRGGALDLRAFTRPLREALGECRRSLGADVKRLELVAAGRAPFLVCWDGVGGARILEADTASPPRALLELPRLRAFARALGEGASVTSEALLEQGDAYYYATHFEPELPLPVLRTRFSSGLTTYVNAKNLRLERRYTSAGAAYRWLYHGLHSLDYPALYRRSSLWHALILTALLGAGSLAGTGAWAFVVRQRKRSAAPAPRVAASSRPWSPL